MYYVLSLSAICLSVGAAERERVSAGVQHLRRAAAAGADWPPAPGPHLQSAPARRGLELQPAAQLPAPGLHRHIQPGPILIRWVQTCRVSPKLVRPHLVSTDLRVLQPGLVIIR